MLIFTLLPLITICQERSSYERLGGEFDMEVTETNYQRSSWGRKFFLPQNRTDQALRLGWAFFDEYNRRYKDERMRQEVQSKLQLLNSQYSAYDSLPSTIADGWHNVAVTDASTYWSEEKVYVKDNKVVRLVIENCINLGMKAIGTIKQCKTMLNVNGFGNGKNEMGQVFFLYDLEGSNFAQTPRQPGVVCFWTEKEKCTKEPLILNRNKTYDRIPRALTSAPDCFGWGSKCYVMKPGTYNVRVPKKGDDKGFDFRVKEGYCLKLLVD